MNWQKVYVDDFLAGKSWKSILYSDYESTLEVNIFSGFESIDCIGGSEYKIIMINIAYDLEKVNHRATKNTLPVVHNLKKQDSVKL